MSKGIDGQAAIDYNNDNNNNNNNNNNNSNNNNNNNNDNGEEEWELELQEITLPLDDILMTFKFKKGHDLFHRLRFRLKNSGFFIIPKIDWQLTERADPESTIKNFTLPRRYGSVFLVSVTTLS